MTDPNITDVCGATFGSFGADYNCVITSGALNASPNVTQETVPATWCAPEQQTPKVGETSYSLDLNYLQDPDLVAGLSRFLFENDAKEAWFFMGMDGDNPPKAVGKVRLVSGQIGGEGRTALTASISLPVVGKPMVCFGDSNVSVGVGVPADPNDLSALIFGSVTGGYQFADLAAVKADAVHGDAGTGEPHTSTGGNPRAAFTTGQYVKIAAAGATRVHWSGAAWAAGVA
jgi:hypothetical protein